MNSDLKINEMNETLTDLWGKIKYVDDNGNVNFSDLEVTVLFKPEGDEDSPEEYEEDEDVKAPLSHTLNKLFFAIKDVLDKQ
jgi:hypothetical protein